MSEQPNYLRQDQYGNDIIQGPKHINMSFKEKLIDPKNKSLGVVMEPR